MSSRLGSLLYAAALVVVLGAGCAVPRAVPTVLTTSTVSVSEGATSPGIPTGSTLTAQPTSAAASPSVSRTTTASSNAERYVPFRWTVDADALLVIRRWAPAGAGEALG